MVNENFGLLCVAPLFVPGDRPERFEKAAACGADAIIIDLEDAVAPAAKAKARENLRVDFTALPVFVRVNAVGTPWHAEDVAAIEGTGVAGIVLPKADGRINFAGLPTHHKIIVLIETARGLADARPLAANPRVARLAFGSIDFCADMGCSHTRTALLAARCEFVMASRLCEIAPPLDGVTAAFDDFRAAEEDARHACELGFGGKLCIHPEQVPAVLRGMSPRAEEIAWAEQVVAAGEGVSVVDNTMIDGAVRLRARGILARSDHRNKLMG